MGKTMKLKDGTEVELFEQSGDMDACPGCRLPAPVPKPGPVGDAPQEGDETQCMACGMISYFDEGLRMRGASREELQAVLDRDGVESPRGAAAFVWLERTADA